MPENQPLSPGTGRSNEQQQEQQATRPESHVFHLRQIGCAGWNNGHRGEAGDL
jgi:hypothetical protein